ncbi:MAG: signal peptidase II [Candidatus Brocadiales bacterium]
MPNRFSGPYGPLFVVVLLGIVLDQATKWAAFRYLADSHNHDTVVRITSFLNLSLSRNEGGVFGFFQGGTAVLIALSIVAVFVVIWMYVRSEEIDSITTMSMGGILAGATGNLIDRVYFRYVRDFIDLHVGTRHWPTFNVADALICVGVGIMVLNILAPGSLWPRRPRD